MRHLAHPLAHPLAPPPFPAALRQLLACPGFRPDPRSPASHLSRPQLLVRLGLGYLAPLPSQMRPPPKGFQ